MGKSIARSEIPALVERLRGEGKTIVTFNGSFDVLHAGHIRCLQEAKKQGDVLIIPLNSDVGIQRYKGTTRPVVPEGDRAEMLAALACVDYVVLFDDIVPMGILSEIRPDVHCNGADWGPCCIEKDAVEQGGGRIHILQWAPGRSTSELLKKIRSLKESPRAVMLAATLASVPEEARAQLSAAGLLVLDLSAGASPEILAHMRDEHGLALSSSWVISPEMTDVITGRLVNAKTVLVGTAPEGSVMPHYQVADVEEALALVLGR
ncbi:adenylyltransferase/cytidyltransferase family protein [Planctomycetota bacterium]